MSVVDQRSELVGPSAHGYLLDYTTVSIDRKVNRNCFQQKLFSIEIRSRVVKAFSLVQVFEIMSVFIVDQAMIELGFRYGQNGAGGSITSNTADCTKVSVCSGCGH